MDKNNLQTLKGFRDFLPEEAKKRQYLVDKLKGIFENFGFDPLETPAIEYKEILLGKSGEETDKLMYSFKDQGERDVALKYDQTVPTARVLATYSQELPMPFRRYQIQTVWRADKPQSGRYREFLQCDADIYGSASSLADAEVISLSYFVYKSLGFNNFKIYLNDRKTLFELMNLAAIPENLHMPTISMVDKLDRKSQDEVKSDLINIGLTESMTDHLFHHLDEAKPSAKISEIIKYAIALGVKKEALIFQARLARGLDYYTSTIFEIKIEEYKSGSVLGGGRYDALIERLSGINIPAVGFAVGFDRTLEAMDLMKLFPKKDVRSGLLVSVFNPNLVETSISVVSNLRDNGIPAELFVDDTKDLRKQIKYADKKKVRWLVVIGPDEVDANSVILKDLESGYQEVVKLKDLIKKLKK